MVRPLTALLALLTASLLTASSAWALPSCGSQNQPACVEDAPPGVELKLTAAENPHGLKPLTRKLSGDKNLWADVRGHEPYGFNAISTGVDGTILQEEVMLHQQMGASMARIGLDWAAIQYYPNTGQGGPSWNYHHHTDVRYKAYIKAGVRPLLVLARTPRRFTRHAGTRANSYVKGCEYSDACHNPPTEEHLDDLARFARDAAKRYPLAAGFEIWNEPNHSNPFWGHEQPDPEYYARMLEVAHDAIKKVRPTMPVLGGSLATFDRTVTDSTGAESMNMRIFLARMLVAGASDHMDAVSYHPYLGSYPTQAAAPTLAQQDAALFTRIMATDNAVLQAYAQAGRPMKDRVVATEVGASTTDGFTEERQAAWLRLRYWAWDTESPLMPALPVDGAFIHRPVEETNPEWGFTYKAGFGLVKVKDDLWRFRTKPAYCAFRTEFGGFDDCPEYLSIVWP